ncbi:MAG: 2-oxo-3-hexenedioate decarboxylase [Halioglobus sp.]|jgi:2-oxo-3-hexenedioate decarboxylase
MDEIDLPLLAERLDRAAAEATATSQLSSQMKLSLTQAYGIQELSIARRLERGESLIGVKAGFTSKAKMEQMGVSDLIWGRLTDAMQLENGGSLDLANYVHPRVEPEVAFLLGKPLSGDVSEAEAASAVAAIAPALEIIDSRYQDFKFSLEDVVADNSSSSSFVVGDWQPPEFDYSALDMALEFGGQVRQSGSSAEIYGHPIRSLVAIARLAAESGVQLEAGWIFMAGGATAAEAITPNTRICNRVEHLGTVSINVGGAKS